MRFSEPIRISHTPPTYGARVGLADMMGTGTHDVLWSHPAASSRRKSHAYLDLTAGEKPYLLTQVDNGFGKQTDLQQTYDLAGNRLGLDHRDLGERRFYYRANGQIACMVDAEGNRIEHEYDVLDRPLRTLANGEEIAVFGYDEIARPNQTYENRLLGEDFWAEILRR